MKKLNFLRLREMQGLTLHKKDAKKMAENIMSLHKDKGMRLLDAAMAAETTSKLMSEKQEKNSLEYRTWCLLKELCIALQISSMANDKWLKIKKLENVRKVLVEKLIEWAKNEYHAEILIDIYLKSLEAMGWDEDDILSLLEDTKNYFVDGFIRDRLIYEATAIKVNAGY